MSHSRNNSRYQLLPNDDTPFENNVKTYKDESYELHEVKSADSPKRTRLNYNGYGGLEKEILLIDKPIYPGESLASISLKYRIPIPELKRVNKIHKDNEFYALKTVKVPARSNSALLELLNNELENSKDSVISSHHVHLENEDDFCLTESPLEAARESLARRTSTSSFESVDYNTLHSTLPVNYETPEEKFISSFSGTDWGISWWKLLVAVAMILFGVPLLYFYYFRKIDLENHSR